MMKRFRLIDVAIMVAVAAIGAGLLLRIYRPDFVSRMLTDLTRRENVTVAVAVPNPWRRAPLADLPKMGDLDIPEPEPEPMRPDTSVRTGRDQATFVGFRMTEGDTSFPVALFHVAARVDEKGRRWFKYSELLPGANFYFRTDRYQIEGVILAVERS